MASRIFSRALLPLLLISGSCAVSGVCVAQRYEPPPPPLTVDPCAVKPNPKIPVAPDPKAKSPVCPPPASAGAPSGAPTNGAPSAAEQFPFPGDAPVPNTAKPSGADKFPFPGDAAPSAPAAMPAPAPKQGSVADQFPYPGETKNSPDAVPEGNTPRYVPDSPVPGGSAKDGSSSSSSSSSSDSLPTAADDDKAAPTDDAADVPTAKKGRRPLPKVSALSPDQRVTEDLTVAKFYSGRGNYEAAYLRSKDATQLLPDDAESHFVLAQAAQKLKKNDEAVAEYNLYLKLDPGGDWAKAAQKGLSELQ